MDHKITGETKITTPWMSKRLSDENIEPPLALGKNLAPIPKRINN